jgi:hypothetical protein
VRWNGAHRFSGATVRRLVAVTQRCFTATSGSGGRRRALVGPVARGWDEEGLMAEDDDG